MVDGEAATAPVTMTVDGRTVSVPSGATILTAARALGISIPTLCHRDGLAPFTSCQICVVAEEGSGRLLPSCSALATPGLAVRTDGPAVQTARRGALELLLSEHLGDCAGPCQGACPAGLDIPAMLRAVAAGATAEAIRVVDERIPLAATLGRVCPAPCEKACRRGRHDAPVAIGLIKRQVGEAALACARPLPEGPATGRRVAVVGAGPAGLSAAWFLRRLGHAVTLFEAAEQAGGGLRQCSPEQLPPPVLAAEIDRILGAGIELRCEFRIGRDQSLTALRAEFAAVIVATGPAFAADFPELTVDRHAGTTSRPGVLVAGTARRDSGHMAVRAVGDGRHAADAADRFLRDVMEQPQPPFHCRMGELAPEEMAVMLATASAAARLAPTAADGGFTPDEAAREAARCLHCECRQRDDCRLRLYAAEYGARARHFMADTRPALALDLSHPELVFEPGKCIRCGLCVRISREQDEPVGLAFLRRGAELRIAPPLGEPLAEALTKTAAACVAACPTGALAWR